MARELRIGYLFRPQVPVHLFKQHRIGNHGLRSSSNLCWCYELQLLITLTQQCSKLPSFDWTTKPLLKLQSPQTGIVHAKLVSSTVLAREELKMPIDTVILHVGLSGNKNLLQEGWKRTTSAWISSAGNTHVFNHKFVFLLLLTFPASGVRWWCKNVKFVFPLSISPLFFRFTRGV